jgi:hypothetical protein
MAIAAIVSQVTDRPDASIRSELVLDGRVYVQEHSVRGASEDTCPALLQRLDQGRNSLRLDPVLIDAPLASLETTATVRCTSPSATVVLTCGGRATATKSPDGKYKAGTEYSCRSAG